MRHKLNQLIRDHGQTDGLFTLAHTPLKSIKFTDANAAQVVINFSDPPVP
jgi:hypothetical protein